MLKGLSIQEAQDKLKEFGYNEIIDTKKVSPLKILFRQIKSNFVIYMLLASVVISFAVGKDTTAYTISAVIIVVISVGFIQEYKAEEAVASLKKMISAVCTVIRNGKKQEVPAKELVPGDIIFLSNGEKIPADCEILESHELRLNESALTGESKEITKKQLNNSNSEVDESKLFMGTYIVNGRGIARVTHTGMNTRFGKIAHLISTAEKELPLQIKVNSIAKYMVTVALLASLATGLLMAFRAPNLDAGTLTEILILVIALSVSAFPEGLPVVLITTLALGAKRMSEKKAVVNRMSIIETLGEVTTICSDKTGTLTRGEMTVKFIFAGNILYEVGGSGYVGHGRITLDGEEIRLREHQELIKLIEAGIRCNDSEIQKTGTDNEYRALGSPTEAALLVLGAKASMYKEDYDTIRVDEHPFNSEKKMMSVSYKDTDKIIVFSKGAPEILLNKCTSVITKTGVKSINPESKEKIEVLAKEMSSNAFRTLCLAYKNIGLTESEYTEDNYTFLGLVAMEDPPREEAINSVAMAKRAGIRVIMATGDSKETAKSIADQIGITGNVLEGKNIDNMTDQELSIAIKETGIFARVKPEHKIRLVKILKEMDEVVAMTGDGVNDAPALKEAHVGIAMGKNGTDVSRSASDLILKDDNFATIVAAIAEGRTVYNNIRKFVTYQLSCNITELGVLFFGMLLAPIFGWQTPLLVSIQILFMNLVTDNLPALTLGTNPTSNDIMSDAPRKRENILNKELIKLLLLTALSMGITTILAYFVSYNILKFDYEESRTTALVTLIIVEIVTAFNFRSFRKTTLNRSPFVNRNLVTASVLSIMFTLVILYTPAKTFFETQSIGITSWVIALVLSSLMLLVNDLIKILNIKRIAYINSTK